MAGGLRRENHLPGCLCRTFEVTVKALPVTQGPGKTRVPSRGGPAPQPHVVRTVAAPELVTDSRRK